MLIDGILILGSLFVATILSFVLYHFMTKDTYYGNFKDVEEDEDD